MQAEGIFDQDQNREEYFVVDMIQSIANDIYRCETALFNKETMCMLAITPGDMFISTAKLWRISRMLREAERERLENTQVLVALLHPESFETIKKNFPEAWRTLWEVNWWES
jgi:hypothetical protein